MSPAPVEVRIVPFGVVLALYPSDLSASVQVQRAPDSAGSPNTGSAEIIGVAAPGQRLYTDIVGSGVWHYRIRSVRPGATSSDWTAWVMATATRIPSEAPQIPEVGGWLIRQGRLESTDGNIILNAPNEEVLIGAATAPLTGVGVFIGSDGASGYDFRAGNPAGDYIHWDESASTLEVSGEITATTGSIGGWEITATDIVSPSGNLRLESDTERILLGLASAPLTGEGVFLGRSGGVSQFRVGDPAGDYLLYDGSALVLAGEIVDSGNLVDDSVITDKINDAAVTLIKQSPGLRRSAGLVNGGFESADTEGWNQTTAQGAVVNAGSGARTGAYVLQIANGAGGPNHFSDRLPCSEGERVLFTAWARPNPGDAPGGNQFLRVRWYDASGSTVLSQALYEVDDAESDWQLASGVATAPATAVEFVVDLGEGSVGTGTWWWDDVDVQRIIKADNFIVDSMIANDQIIARHILANEITAAKIASLSFTGKTATFDTGSIGGWTMSAGALASGSVTIDAANEVIRLGATAFLTGAAGVWMGEDGAGGYDFRVGNPAGDYVAWDASAGTLEVAGTITAGSVVAAGSFTASAPVFTGSVSIEGGEGATLIALETFDPGGIFIPYGQISIKSTSGTDLMRIRGGSVASLSGDLNLGAPVGSVVRIDTPTEIYDPLDVDGPITGESLALDQVAADDAILTMASSDVAHGITDLAPTDVYGSFQKHSATAGALRMTGLGEAGAGLSLWGIAGTAPSTGKNTSASGAVGVVAGLQSGTSYGAIGSNGNLFVVANASNTRFIVDAEGDIHYDGTANTYDHYEDASLVRAVTLATAPKGDVIRSEFDQFVRYNEDDLIALGLLGDTRENGGLVCLTRMQQLHSGALWQQETKLRRAEAALRNLLERNPDLNGGDEVLAILSPEAT